MRSEELRRRSHWIMRAQEWDEPRARYPNVWHEGMPRHVLAFDTVASRMRLGDLLAVYYPSSQRHRERSERFLGLARIVGLRRAHDPAYAWLDLDTAFRFQRPLDLGETPRRVFLCCDPGWPERDVALFRRVFDAAVAAGWKPQPEEREGAEPSAPAPESAAERPDADQTPSPPEGPPEAREPEGSHAASEEARTTEEPREKVPPTLSASTDASPRRSFAGATLCGDMRDPRDGTWLAVVELAGDALLLVRLEATGRSGLHGLLRNPDGALMRTEGLGLAFPFGVPLAFAESLLGGAFPAEGWWALARRIERIPLPEYLVALTEFRAAHGPLRRRTDEARGAPSPLGREGNDPGSMAYHGIKLIAEERSRYAIRPFERAQGKLLLEVNPAAAIELLGLAGNRRAILEALGRAEPWPLNIPEPMARKCASRAEALDAAVAARCAALAFLTGETDKSADQLDPEESERIRREGWIYGLASPAVPAA